MPGILDFGSYANCRSPITDHRLPTLPSLPLRPGDSMSAQEVTDNNAQEKQQRKRYDPGHADLPEKDLEGHHLHVLDHEDCAQKQKDYYNPSLGFHSNTPGERMVIGNP
jgi:hypothetical protein